MMATRNLFTWTALQRNRIQRVQDAVRELAEYKPLTLRQVFYQLVKRRLIENTRSQYNMLSKLVKYARIDGYLMWEDIEDRSRALHDLTGWFDKDRFSGAEMKHFLQGYRRDLLRGQGKYLEIWIEKDALSSLFIRVAVEYTIPVVVCTGFSSVSFLHEFKERLRFYPNRRPVMLYFGDFDPSGLAMLPAMRHTVEEELGIHGVAYKHVALTEDDVDLYKLPNNLNAAKKKDPRTKKHLAKYGNKVVELDSMSPDVLEDKIRSAIEDELDMGVFRHQQDVYNAELAELGELKCHVERLLQTTENY